MPDTLGDLAARLIATPAIADQTSDGGKPGIFIDTPHDLERDVGYRTANGKPFIFFGPLYKTSLTDCGGFECRLRIYVESFAADRREALALMDAVIAALDERYGAADFADFSPAFLSSGEILDSFSPFSRYADFRWSE